MSHMDKIVNTTLESFIVKAYSGDKEAQVCEPDENDNLVPTKHTIDAAKMILDKLIVSSNPLASTGHGYVLQNAYHNLYLTIPDNCPWLYQVIENSGRIPRNNIFKSSARDSLVMSVVYSGVPAWALTWITTAEENYEAGDGPKEVGLHIEQAENGRNWSKLPNLYPENLWTAKERELRYREGGIISDVHSKMEEAREKGLVIRDPIDTGYYDLMEFIGDSSAKEVAGSPDLSNSKRYESGDVLRMLVDEGNAKYKKIDYVGFIMTDNTIKDPIKKEEFIWDIACRIVRKNITLKKKLEYALEVADAIEKRVALHNPTVVDASQIVLFAGALRWELVSFNATRKKWTVLVDDVERAMGGAITDNLQRMCAHYFGFSEFIKLDPDILGELQEHIEELNNKSEDDVLEKADERAENIKKAITGLIKAKKETEKPWAEDSPFAKCANESPWPMATLDFAEVCHDKGYDADTIRRFYKTLSQNL